MKRFIYLLLILSSLISTPGICQEKKLEFGILFSPNYSYRFLSGESRFIDYNTIEQGMFSYDAGITADYSLNAKAVLSSGLLYSRKGYSFNNAPTIGNDFIDGSRIIEYLEVPILYKRILHNENHFKFYVMGGITNNILINAKTKREDGETFATKRWMRTYNPGVALGVGIFVPAGNKFGLAIEPIFKPLLLDELNVTDSSVKRRLYTLGVNIIGKF